MSRRDITPSGGQVAEPSQADSDVTAIPGVLRVSPRQPLEKGPRLLKEGLSRRDITPSGGQAAEPSQADSDLTAVPGVPRVSPRHLLEKGQRLLKEGLSRRDVSPSGDQVTQTNHGFGLRCEPPATKPVFPRLCHHHTQRHGLLVGLPGLHRVATGCVLPAQAIQHLAALHHDNHILAASCSGGGQGRLHQRHSLTRTPHPISHVEQRHQRPHRCQRRLIRLGIRHSPIMQPRPEGRIPGDHPSFPGHERCEVGIPGQGGRPVRAADSPG